MKNLCSNIVINSSVGPLCNKVIFDLLMLNTNIDITLILTGKTGSGKTTTRKLLEEYGFEPIITTTTRLAREGEKEGVDYLFVNNGEINSNNYSLIGENKKGEKYGINNDDLDFKGKKVLVTGSTGVIELEEIISNEMNKYKNFLLINLDFSNFTLIKRLLKRGDTKNEIKTRLKNDNLKFSNFATKMDKLTISNGNKDDIVEYIVNHIINKYYTFFNS